MRTSRLLLISSLALVTVATALPAEARFGWGIGTGLRIPGTGIHTGIGYSRSRWGSSVGTNVYVDAGYYLNRRRERRRDRDREEVRENVSLRVSPNNAWVYLNGVPVEAHGKDEFSLPPGRHRLEFLREGYRTEVAELDVQPGVRYKVERKLRKLERGELGDARLERLQRPVSIEEALRSTGPAKPVAEQDKTPDLSRDRRREE